MKIYHILYHIYFHSASFFVNFRADFSLSIALHFTIKTLFYCSFPKSRIELSVHWCVTFYVNRFTSVYIGV